MKRPTRYFPFFVVAVLILFAMTASVWHFAPATPSRETATWSVGEPAKPHAPERKTSGEASVSAATAREPLLPTSVQRKAETTNVFRTGPTGREYSFVRNQVLGTGFETDREESARSDQPDEAIKWRMMQLVDENGFIPHNALINAWEEGRQIPMDPAAWPVRDQNQNRPQDNKTDEIVPGVAGIQPTGWTWLGPGNVGGRIRSIVVHPSDPQTMWVGSVGGGVWKTTNGGTSWSALNDFMANLAVSCMAIDPGNPNVLYAGTGEGFFNIDALRGAGMFKTTDGGTTWTQLTSTTSSSWYYVNRIAINPSNGQIILAATNTGIWRSTDAGTTWSQRATTSMIDINFNPTDGNKCIASGNQGARYSTDGGLTWNTATGVPTNGRIEVAYSLNTPAIVYASVFVNSGEVYRSDNGGQSYVLVNTGLSYLDGQGWYDNIIWVDPTNSNIVIVGGIDLWRSTDGGVSFTKISQWFSAPQSAHADQHAIIESSQFNGTTNKTVFFGNDGGIYRATDVYSVSPTTGWTELNNNLGITQFYGGAGNATSGRIFGGAQDNGTLRYVGGTETWDAPFGGDGGWCAADPTDSNYFFGEYVYLQIHRSTNGGASQSSYIYSGLTDAEQKRANFIAPFILDPNNPNTLLAGGDQLWRSTNAKASTPSWTAVKSSVASNISAVAVAKGNSNIVWVGHDNGNVYYTTNGTASSPTWTRADLGSPALPDRYCTRITIDPTNSSRVYVTFGGFSLGNVWRTDNNGLNWTNITGNLPSAPVYTLAVWQQNANNLYVGTEVGIFASANGGQSWSPSNDGPTNCSVDELFWMNDILVAVTHGRGMFSINIAGGGSCTYSLNPTSQSFGSSGGNGSFAITTTSSGCAWTAVSNASWITTSSSGSGNGTVNFAVAANTGTARTGTISVNGQTFTVSEAAGGGGCPSTTISVGQTINGTLTTSDCIFTGTTRYVDVYNFSGTAGQQIAVAMTSSVFDTYLYLLDGSNQFIAQDDDGGGGTDSRIPTTSGGFTLPATGTFTIYATSFSADGTTGSTGAYAISLSSGSCSYALSPSSQSFGSSGGSGSFGVTTSSGCAWTAVSNANWITTSSSGAGNGSVNFAVAANTGAARTGTIAVGGQTFTISQAAAGGGCPSTTISLGQTINGTLTTSDCIFTGTTRNVDVYNFNGTAGQQIVIAMNSSIFDTYLYLLDGSNQLLAQDDDGGGGTNSRIPTFSGPFTLPATGTFTIYATSFSADGTTGSTGAYAISLSSASCSYTLSPSSQSFGSSGGNGSFTVITSAGCAWSAVSNASWITTTSSGSGNGNVNFTVAANTGAPRTGTITVNGQTFTVSQSAASINVTVQTNPSGRAFTVDGTTFGATQTFSWTPGSNHTIATASPQSGTTGTQFVWSNWSDGGAISHTVAPTTSATYTANFTTKFMLTMNAGAGGTVSPSSAFFNSGQSVSISATANSGFTFSSWTGSGTGSFSGTTNLASVTMNGPITETASFTQANVPITVQTSPNSRTFTVDGTTFSSTQTFSWTPGSNHTIATASPQSGTTGTQFVWSSWSDGGAISHTVAPTTATTYTANFTTQFLLTMTAGAGGSVSPSTAFFNSGQSVNISATPNAGFSFSSWSGTGTGSFSGATNPASVTMNSPISETASFVAISKTIQLSAPSYSTSEGSQILNVNVTRSGDVSAAASVNFATSDGAGLQNCNVANGKASSRCDYISTLGTVNFTAGEISKTIPILIVDDSYAEGDEIFNITLTNPLGASLGAQALATITIKDNESTSGVNQIDLAGFFVNEHYFDFLNRQPDASGLAFWTNEITLCGSNQACIELKRVNVSAAYFLSIEFQQTGYLVERLYKVAYGDTTGNSKFGGDHTLSVPIIRLNEFLPDTQEISKGVVVGQVGWEQAIENNKVAFIAEFVQRGRFVSAFPTSMTPEAFVTKLHTNAGLAPIGSSFVAVITEFHGAANTTDVAARARVLRLVAENSTLSANEFNRAFVLMQFFGYLRRNPNDPQDTDYSGYDFWLTKLNQFSGNFANADMVKAFITSGEYRQRFGP
jgi:Divergent InlB B-repeat domain/Calx-beta domain/Viral BACON domain/Bacterial pre-peptidase C-terminal domain